MNLGTLVVLLVLVAIVGAIVASWIRSYRAGRHISCDQCGGCDCASQGASSGCSLAQNSGSASCGCAAMMVDHIDTALKESPKDSSK